MLHLFVRLRRHRTRADRSLGQSVAELGLVMPVFLLLAMMAIDFGRVYLGWINAQNLVRIAATYAANHPEAWDATPDAAVQGRYQELIANDAKKINCDLTGGIQDPVFAAGYDLGDLVQVEISCSFDILTPVIDRVLPDPLFVTASAAYPIRTGDVAGLPGGGGGPAFPPPTASFVGSPLSGYAPLTVKFTDTSTNRPTTWFWAFQGNGNSTQRDPTMIFDLPGTYTVSLTAQNSAGDDTATYTAYITVDAPPTSGPIPEFTANPRTGNDPLNVTFTDTSTGSPTGWAWTFGDPASGGQNSSTVRNPTHRYNTPGVYTVSLTVTNATGSNTQTKTSFIYVDAIPCRVPSFINTKRNDAQAAWTAAGFTTAVQFQAGSGNYTIKTQTLAATTIPNAGCGATITVGP